MKQNKIDLSKRTKGEYKVSSFLDIYANDTAIAACYVGRLPDEECEANAAYIVLAVNNFDKLVEALHNCVITLDAINYRNKTDYAPITLGEAKQLLQSIEKQQQ